MGRDDSVGADWELGLVDDDEAASDAGAGDT
jgi:hypothetical protein